MGSPRDLGASKRHVLSPLSLVLKASTRMGVLSHVAATKEGAPPDASRTMLAVV